MTSSLFLILLKTGYSISLITDLSIIKFGFLKNIIFIVRRNYDKIIIMKKNHYVYILINNESVDERKYYFGVRSCDCKPENDKYFSSSNIIKKMIKEKNTFEKRIIKTFNTRREALDYEIFLHKVHDVSNNKYFYNLAKQTSNKFDTSGFIFINGVRISTKDYYCSTKKIHTCGKITLRDNDNNFYYVDIDDERRKSGVLFSISKGVVPIKLEDGKFVNIPKNEYNKEIHKTSNYGKIAVKDTNGNVYLTNSDNPEYLSGNLVSVHKGKVLCRDINGDIFLIDMEKYKSGNYVGVNKGRIYNEKNPNAKHIIILDKNGNIVYECLGNFKEICENNNLPFASLSKSYRSNGTKIYNSKRGLAEAKKLNNEKFIGWYAKIC